MKLYIVRHGETDWNKVKKLQGQSDISLNEFGRHLAIETGKGLKDIAFDVCFTSPLDRAKETAKLILGERNVPVIEDERIEEISFGDFEGRCCSVEGWNLPDEFELFFTDPQHFTAPNHGEDLHTLRSRVASFLDELCGREDEYKDKNILVATHGAALCGMINYMKGRSMAEYWGKGVHKNCAVTIVEVKNHTPYILEENKVYYTDKVKDW